MGFLFLLTFKMYFDKLEKKIKKQKTLEQFGFYAWIEPKKWVHEILTAGSQKKPYFSKEIGFSI